MIHYNTQVGKILRYLQNNPNKLVTGGDFASFSLFKVWVGYESSSILSTMKRKWLVEFVEKRKPRKLFFKIWRSKSYYKITQKWLETNLV